MDFAIQKHIIYELKTKLQSVYFDYTVKMKKRGKDKRHVTQDQNFNQNKAQTLFMYITFLFSGISFIIIKKLFISRVQYRFHDKLFK